MKSTVAVVCFLLACMIIPGSVIAEEGSEEKAIKQAALDYIEGWYEGSAERMERALHPELVKRAVFTDPASGKSSLQQMNAMTLVQYTRAGYGTKVPVDQQQKDVSILDKYENIAVVKVIATEWIDYLQIAKYNGEWKIVNVLWEMKPKEK